MRTKHKQDVINNFSIMSMSRHRDDYKRNCALSAQCLPGSTELSIYSALHFVLHSENTVQCRQSVHDVIALKQTTPWLNTLAAAADVPRTQSSLSCSGLAEQISLNPICRTELQRRTVCELDEPVTSAAERLLYQLLTAQWKQLSHWRRYVNKPLKFI